MRAPQPRWPLLQAGQVQAVLLGPPSLVCPGHVMFVPGECHSPRCAEWAVLFLRALSWDTVLSGRDWHSRSQPQTARDTHSGWGSWVSACWRSSQSLSLCVAPSYLTQKWQDIMGTGRRGGGHHSVGCQLWCCWGGRVGREASMNGGWRHLWTWARLVPS